MKQEKFSKKEIVKKSENISDWYQDVILRSEMADYAPVKGTMVIRPYGYAIWENIHDVLDKMIKKGGVKNAYFPLFIPESLLKKEKAHVEGFSPELAVVTIGGNEELKEKLIVRPTSETIMYAMFAKWLQSWRELPILINQWVNVVRWEKRTYLFLRTTEFLWQEGHTVHETHDEAMKEVMWAMDNYVDVYRNHLGVYGIPGRKSESEKFAGADATYTYESLMPDGKALQCCTSHDLGQNFAKAFELKFLGRDGKEQIPWQTSWGFPTRSIGGIVLVHGDDNGLVMPPKIAPVQAVIIPIVKSKEGDDKVLREAKKIKDKLSGLRAVEVDEREGYSLGWKINSWELKGVPLRIELGEKEIESRTLTLVRRDNFEKIKVKFDDVEKEVNKILDEIQNNLLGKHKKFVEENTHIVDTYEQFKDIMSGKRGFISAFWCEDKDCEAKIKEETKATTRCLPLDSKKGNGKCVHCGKPAVNRWLFAQAY